MPIPGTHAARQMDPGKCDKIRQQNMGKGITFLFCVHGGKADVESVHFDASQYTAEEAKTWLKKHDFKIDRFEPAAPDKAAAAALAELAKTSAALAELTAKQSKKQDEVVAMLLAAGPMDIRGAACGGGMEFLEAQPGADGLPQVSMLAYTGVPMNIEGFYHPVVVDLETLKVPRQKVPILRSHEPDRIAGHSTKIDLSQQRLKASGVLSGEPEHNKDLVSTGKRGFPWQVSLGAQTAGRPKGVEFVPSDETAKVNGRVWPGPLLVARGATLRELSILSMGADGNTDAGFGAEGAPDLNGGTGGAAAS